MFFRMKENINKCPVLNFLILKLDIYYKLVLSHIVTL